MDYTIKTADLFGRWINGLKDKISKRKILARLARIENGNFGNDKYVGIVDEKALYELRFFFGNGFRIYYTIQETTIVLLLTGGDKSSQTQDIKKAKQLLKELQI